MDITQFIVGGGWHEIQLVAANALNNLGGAQVQVFVYALVKPAV